MKAPWTAQGVADFETFEIPEGERTQIELELKNRDAGSPTAEFFKDVEFAIARYRSSSTIKVESRPAIVRASLNEAFCLALDLESRLETMDANSRSLIRKAAGKAFYKFRSSSIQPLLEVLQEAVHLADQLPGAGKLPDKARMQLAEDVADAIQLHLNSKPTSTREGLFESLLTIILEVATERKVESVHALTEQVIKAKAY